MYDNSSRSRNQYSAIELRLFQFYRQFICRNTVGNGSPARQSYRIALSLFSLTVAIQFFLTKMRYHTCMKQMNSAITNELAPEVNNGLLRLYIIHNTV